MRSTSILLVATIVISLSGCTFFSAAGPPPAKIAADGNPENPVSFIHVPVTPHNVGVLGYQPIGAPPPLPDAGPSPSLVLGAGDVVAVRIFESASGGLFTSQSSTSTSGNFVDLPDQLVDNSGNITVPYAGAVRAAGRSIPAVQADIVERLDGRALDPQVVITLKEQKSSMVSVLGEVNASGRFPVNPSGERLLDVIALAGGPKNHGFDSIVTLQRGSYEASIPFEDLVEVAASNTFVRGGDTVVVSRHPRTFVAFGAAGQEGRFEFEASRLSLAEALGKSMGLLDTRANPASVYVYRIEEGEILREVGYNLERFPSSFIPTVYSFNLRDPAGYFIASNFEMIDQDVVYVANAPYVDVSKVFLLVTGGAVAGAGVKSLVN